MEYFGVFMVPEKEEFKTYKLIITEWITTIAVFVTCFAYLSYKIEKQADRTDKLYEMFIELVKDKK